MNARAAGALHGYLITLRQDPFGASTVWGIGIKKGPDIVFPVL